MTSEAQIEQLVTRVAAGEPAALEILYDQFSPAIMGFALRIVQEHPAAEDVVQETFWRLWKHAAKYNPERGAFLSWLFAIARNVAIDRLRRMKHNPASSLEASPDGSMPLENQPDPGVNVQESVYDNIKHRQVRAALQELPEEQRQVIRLAFFQGLTRQEIAEVIQAPLGTVHTRARLAMQKLRSKLLEIGIEE